MPIGLPEGIIIAPVALLILGPRRPPEAGRSLGGGLREFKNAVTGRIDDDGKEAEPTSADGSRLSG